MQNSDLMLSNFVSSESNFVTTSCIFMLCLLVSNINGSTYKGHFYLIVFNQIKVAAQILAVVKHKNPRIKYF